MNALEKNEQKELFQPQNQKNNNFEIDDLYRVDLLIEKGLEEAKEKIKQKDEVEQIEKEQIQKLIDLSNRFTENTKRYTMDPK